MSKKFKRDRRPKPWRCLSADSGGALLLSSANNASDRSEFAEVKPKEYQESFSVFEQKVFEGSSRKFILNTSLSKSLGRPHTPPRSTANKSRSRSRTPRTPTYKKRKIWNTNNINVVLR